MNTVYEIQCLISSWRITILGAFFLPNLRLFCNEICMSSCNRGTVFVMYTVYEFTVTWLQPPSIISVMITLGWFSWNSFLFFFNAVYNKPRMVYGTLWADTGAVHIRNMLHALLTLVWNKTGIFWPGCSHFSSDYYISSFLPELSGMCWSSPTEPCSFTESPINTFVIEVGRSRC